MYLFLFTACVVYVVGGTLSSDPLVLFNQRLAVTLHIYITHVLYVVRCPILID